jgi:hypothetical protein
MNKYNLTLMVTSCLTVSLVSGVAGAEIKRSSYSTHDGEYVKVLVSDDNWQPEPFDQGIVIPATFVQTESIVLDGVDNEMEWLAAEEITVPLSYGAIEYVQIKALYTDEDALLRVRWADDSEDRQYHPWVWNEEKGNYETGPQVDDALILNFEAGCDWFPSLLSGYEFDFDGWYWTAGRSNQEGLAIDLYGSMKRKRLRKTKLATPVATRRGNGTSSSATCQMESSIPKLCTTHGINPIANTKSGQCNRIRCISCTLWMNIASVVVQVASLASLCHFRRGYHPVL